MITQLQPQDDAGKEVKKTSKNYDYATKINYLFRDARNVDRCSCTYCDPPAVELRFLPV
jgi:hypothetical protein